MYEIKICSDIVCDEEQSERVWFGLPEGVTYNTIQDAIAGIPAEETDICLRIFSQGGNVREGWAIVDALRATGKNISAIIEGDIASMASVVLLSASVRKAMPHARILIHRPYINYVVGTLNDKTVEDLRKSLADETERVVDFYVERTGADRGRLIALMDEERYISAEEAMELGFITEILAPLSARQKDKLTPKTKNQKMKNNSLFKKIVNALKGALDVVGYEVTTATGDIITIEKEEGDIAVGDPASPDGEHVLPDGRTIIIADGVITEIKEAEPTKDPEPTPAEDEEKAKLQERINALEKEVEDLKGQVKSEADVRILNAVAVAGGEEWLAKATTNPQPKVAKKNATTKASSTAKEERDSWVSRRRAQLENKN